MKNPFNIKKDINQINDTGKKIEEKAPLFVSTIKSIFVIIKWILFLFIIICIIIGIGVAINNYQQKKQIEKEGEVCKIKCSIPLGPSFSDYTSEQLNCYTDCLGLPSLKGLGLPK